MSSLVKLTGKRLSKEKTDQLIDKFLMYVAKVGVNPQEIIHFGSGAKYTMTTFSDLDFVFIFKNSELLSTGKKAYYSENHEAEIPFDVIFTTRDEFDRKALIGCVFFICKSEGKSVFKSASHG